MTYPQIAATVTSCVQIGENVFVDKQLTKIFDPTVTICELFDWARGLGLHDISLSEIVLSEVVK